MTDRPFFSVVVPVYNRANLLENSLTSVLRQRFKDFEVIAVNDGSTDSSKEIVSRISLSDKRVILINQENKERGAARNTGITNAAGKYIVFFDSDDIMHENHLEILHKNILEQNYPVLIATYFDFIDESGKKYSSDSMKLPAGYYDYTLFLNGNPLACNVCVKKENPEPGLFIEDRKYAIKEDWLFLLQNTFKNKLFIVDTITISMYDHEKRSMRMDNNELINKTRLAHEWILNNIPLNDDEKKTLLAHVNYFCGIHSYLNNSKKEAMDYTVKAIKYGGYKMKYIALLIKSIIGKKVISRFK
jgi:GalNAc5-diNAcBac-PP-undecaprenol beta-1,3-glucosyltransferase